MIIAEVIETPAAINNQYKIYKLRPNTCGNAECVCGRSRFRVKLQAVQAYLKILS